MVGRCGVLNYRRQFPTLDAAVERSQLLQVLNEVPLNEVPLNEVHEVPVKVGRLRLRQIAYQTGSG
jgi:hypothetical protein